MCKSSFVLYFGLRIYVLKTLLKSLFTVCSFNPYCNFGKEKINKKGLKRVNSLQFNSLRPLELSIKSKLLIFSLAMHYCTFETFGRMLF